MTTAVEKSYRYVFAAGFIFIVGVCLSVFLWADQRYSEKALVNQKFLQQSSVLKKELEQNLDRYEQLVNGVTGLFNAAAPITQNEWDAYMETVKKMARQYPGIVSVGFSMPDKDKELVVFSTPFSQYHDSDVGVDLLKYPNRKAILSLANKTGEIELSSQIRAIEAGALSNKTPYFGLFGPVYNKDHKTIYGHVFVEVNVSAMMTHLLKGEDRGVLLKIYFKNSDGVDQILYEAEKISVLKSGLSPSSPTFSQVTSIPFNKMEWSVYFYSTPSLEAGVDRKGPAIVFFSCVLISFLGSVIVWSFNTANRRSRLLDRSNQEILMLNKNLETKVKIRTKELERANAFLEKNNELVSLKNELLSLMQACSSVKEVLVLVGEFFKRMFIENNGRIYFYNRNTLLLDLVSAWGEEASKAPETIKMGDCFALHYFHPYRINGVKSELICGHMLQEKNHSPYFCIPIIDSEDVFGLITLLVDSKEQDNLKNSIENIEKAISLTCVNLDLKRRLQYDAIHDPLTGLYNRRYFEESLLRETMKARRSPIVFNILMLDVDNFKQINDKYGHQMGDEVLKSIANLLKHDVRSSDVACRFGGEEFIVMMETSLEYGYKRADDIRKKIAALTFSSGDDSLSLVTVSIGLATYPKHADSMEKLIKNADEALYKAKNLGKNQVVIFGDWNGGQNPDV